MKKPRPTDIGASIRARLLHIARERGEDVQFVLMRYASLPTKAESHSAVTTPQNQRWRMGAGRNALGALMTAAAVAAGGVLFAGCFGEGCDQADCSDGLFIEFGEGLTSGNYRFVGSADSEPFACEWTETTPVCDVEWADCRSRRLRSEIRCWMESPSRGRQKQSNWK